MRKEESEPCEAEIELVEKIDIELPFYLCSPPPTVDAVSRVTLV